MIAINKAFNILVLVAVVFIMMSGLTIAQELEEQEAFAKYSLEGTTYLKNNIKMIKNVDDLLVLVNKNRNLPSNYVPKDLVFSKVPFPFKGKHPKKKMRREAALALEELFKAAKKEGIELYGLSGYRSYRRQKAIFNYKVRTIGKKAAAKISAYPGQSEHQTGLAMDITSKSVRFQLVEAFENTKEGQWIKENSYKYGFIVRYPKGKEAITGYSYEPWHIRYVGREVAEYIFKRNITLEEFFKELKKDKSLLFVENNQKQLMKKQEELMRNIQKVQLLFLTIPF
ncbi:M15 family metallopeptidase [Crassaminicella indica]|uniref:M15 family metallopeptidase n=1 Tax=Crassaminicella indica TaxID=2855394 RepID=A0ABX8RFN6_9CLOT|nr:M15 family metallopeptidase [Crassaminicella indica]QXM07132.1 M15 family metallopeptidase [Crassaminicella indica]